MSGEVDKKLTQLLNELRNTLLGVQILFAGLLTLPFTERFPPLSALEKTANVTAVISAAAASVMLIAPAQYHRLRWDHEATSDTLQLSNKLATGGAVALTIALSAVLFVIVHVVVGRPLTATVAAAAVGAMAALWFVMPLARRGSSR